jgi:hypothetical protein
MVQHSKTNKTLLPKIGWTHNKADLSIDKTNFQFKGMINYVFLLQLKLISNVQMGNCATCDDPSIYEQNTEAKPMR